MDSGERILDAVTPLFHEHGVRAVGTSRIVEAAGCGKNLLHARFPRRADLVAGYLDRLRERRGRAGEVAVAFVRELLDRAVQER